MPSIPQTQSHDSRPSPSLCLYCKSFRRDLDRVQQLVASLEAHNRDHLPLILSVPAADVALFQARFGKHHFELIPDETLTGRSIPAGWRMQQVVKFHVWQMNLADTVFMLDSDAYFIRDFRRQDFFTQTGEPYFILSSFPTRFAPENTELLTLLQGQNTPPPLDLSQLLLPPVAPQDMGTIPRWRLWIDPLTSQRVRPRRRWIQDLLRRPGLPLEFMPSPLWMETVLQDMWERFLVPRRLNYFDLIKFAPWENHWYGEWLLATQCAPIHPRLPYFLHFSSDEDIHHAQAAGFTVEDFAQHFLGLQLAAGHQELERY